LDIKEHVNTTVCCGAPIFDYTGEVIAAISLSDVLLGPIEVMGKDVAQVARVISNALGYIHT
jgi:DNA-binding IclR family transcriptional regulator